MVWTQGYQLLVCRNLHLTLKMITAQVVETSVTSNSLSKDYPHPEDHDKPIIVDQITFFYQMVVCNL